jgi:hypothetical protein
MKLSSYGTFEKKCVPIFIVASKGAHQPLKDAHQLVSEDLCQLPILWMLIMAMENTWASSTYKYASPLLLHKVCIQQSTSHFSC